MGEETCSTCRFWDYAARDGADGCDEEDKWSRCRRFPPQPNVAHIAIFALRASGCPSDVSEWSQPATYGWEWCGEYQPRKPLPVVDPPTT
jgi:hypothetical protein